ncbi:capsule assembly Wzi family protein [Larkinella sp. VNQ87]|uniref:capsule assembly Wzi family protein n=1 Tax=Larkinella sp. VNQ87 TaxID=3400921 RepID=UPI003C104100
MKQFYPILLTGLFFASTQVFSQSRHASQLYTEIGALVSSTDRTPFWLRANQFGTVPLTAPVGSLRLGLAGTILFSDTTKARFQVHPRRLWSLSYQVEAVGNAGKSAQLLLPEGYIRLAHRGIELVAGRRRAVIGLVDSTLSSGSYAWSGNALPIPKVQFGTRGFVPLGRRGWLAINGFLAHGWFANTWYMRHSFLHQKSLFFRIGKPTAIVRLYAGINHSVQWGGQSDYIDPKLAINGKLPGRLADFPNVLFAIRTNGLNNDRISSFDYVNLYGNHLGTIDFGGELRFSGLNLLLYHQHVFEDVTGIFFKNLPDGLSGIRLSSNRPVSAGFHLNEVLLEFLTTLSQSGPTLYQADKSWKGADNYFNNSQYREGWTYRERVIGTPFLTRRLDIRAPYRNASDWAIAGNRVQMYHVAARATVARQIDLRVKVSYSRNYGIPEVFLSGPPTQLSAWVQVGTPLRWLGGAELTAALALDQGQLYDDAVGGYLGLRKTIWQRR